MQEIKGVTKSSDYPNTEFWRKRLQKKKAAEGDLGLLQPRWIAF